MPAIEEYLVRAHRSDLLRAACTHRPHRCAEIRSRRVARSRWTARP